MLVTVFNSAYNKKPDEYIPLLDALERIKKGTYQDRVFDIMNEKNENKRAKLKKLMPCFTVSGKFSRRAAAGLIEHSGFIVIDIDNCPRINAMRNIINADPYTFACFTSVSGNGLCVIVKIDPKKHREAFEGLESYYYQMLGWPIDPSGKDVCRLRIFSYDPHLYLNEDSKVFKKYLPKVKQEPVYSYIHTDEKFNNVLKQINFDITGDYHQWLRLGFAIAHQFQESGREIFHQISQFSPKYNYQAADKQYTYCLKSNPPAQPVTIAYFYYICKQFNIQVTNDYEKKISKLAYLAKKGGRNKESVKKILSIQNQPVDEKIIDYVFENEDFKTENDDIISDASQFININYDITRNEFTNEYELSGTVMQEEDYNTIYLSVKKAYPKCGKDLFFTIIHSEYTKKYNPIKDYLDSLTYDGNDYIEDLTSVINSNTGTFEFRKLFLTKWLVGIVQSIYSNECNQLMLVFAGEKNTGKSYFFKNLLPEKINPFFASGLIEYKPDNLLLLCNNLIYLIDEYSSDLFNQNILKNILSADYFFVRAPYGKKTIKRKKHASLCATSNDIQVLSDITGNRRIVPFEIIGKFNFDIYNKIDKEKIFAQIIHLYKHGMSSNLTNSEIEELNNYTEKTMSNISIEGELLSLYICQDGTDFRTATEIKTYLESVSNQKLSIKRLGMELKRLGYIREKHKGIYGYRIDINPYRPFTPNSSFNTNTKIYTSEPEDDSPFL